MSFMSIFNNTYIRMYIHHIELCSNSPRSKLRFIRDDLNIIEGKKKNNTVKLKQENEQNIKKAKACRF